MTNTCGGNPAMLTHLDLFSGLGGFALAARWCGIETVGFCEIDPYAQAILKRHWPDVPNFGDIRNVTKQTIDNAVSLCNRYIMGKHQNKKYDQARALYESGLSIGDCAGFYGITRQAMWKILKRRGVEFRAQLKHSEENGFYRGGSLHSKRAAHLVEIAVRKGILIPEPCEVCGDVGTLKDGRRLVQAHHDDYNQPLSVRWLCKKHHHEWHENHKAVEERKGCTPARGVDLLTAGVP